MLGAMFRVSGVRFSEDRGSKTEDRLFHLSVI
jgi:hypothetical protein